MDPELLKKVKPLLNSVLVTVKDTLTVDQLRRDYFNVVGKEIPYRDLGHNNLQSFLGAIPDTVTLIQHGNIFFVKPVVGEQYQYIADMVHGQKTAKKPAIRANWRRPYVPSRYSPPTGPRAFGSYRHPNRGGRSNYRGMRNIAQRQSRPNFYQQKSDCSDWRAPSNGPSIQPLTSRGNFPPTHPTFRPNMPRPHPTDRINSPTLSTVEYRPNAHPAYRPNLGAASSIPLPPSQLSPPSPPSPPSLPSLPSLPPPPPPAPPSPVYDSPKDKLKAKAEQLNISVPAYTNIKAGKKNPYWISKVKVKDTSYSTYPNEFPTSAAAEAAAANAALEGLAKISLLPTKPATKDFAVARRRIVEMVQEENAGIWYDHLCELYKSKFNERLPDKFLDDSRAVKKPIDIVFYTPDEIHWIVLKYSASNPTSGVLPETVESSESVESVETAVEYDGTWPALELPKGPWFVFVTYIRNYCSISIRLIGPTYNEAYENLITEMELHFADEENMVQEKNIVVGEFYACYLELSWHRVLVEKIKGDQAIINFVDYGDDELVSMSTLYKLEKRFTELAMQSISCTLAGVDTNYEHEGMLLELQSLAMSKSLVCEVLSVDPEVSIVLFDTSTEEDVNINERLLKLIPETIPAPKLPSEGRICKSFVTHADKSGDVFVTLESTSYTLLKNVLHDSQYTISKGEPIPGVIDVNKMYLSKSSKDQQWKRSLPRSANLNTNQAIKCRLSNVPPSGEFVWTNGTVNRLLDLLPMEDPLFLKVIKEANGNEPPEIELFKRIQPQNELVSINATLAHDATLFKKKELPSLENSRKTLKDGDPTLLPKAELPPLFPYFDVYVSYAATPHNFGVQSIRQMDELASLMREIQVFYNSRQCPIPELNVKAGNLYIAQHTDSNWYRVKVDHCAGPMVSGLKVDYGDILCTTNDKFLQILPKFCTLPPQCFRASMTGITPVNKDWTPEDCYRFRILAEGKKLVSVVLKVTADYESLPFLELKLINTESDLVDIHLDDLFVKEKRALRSAKGAK